MWTDVVIAVASTAAVLFAAFAWMAALNTLRTSYRPVVRIATTFAGGGVINQANVVLKNIGFGPALSVMLYEARDVSGEPLGQVAIVEVLGDGADERHRAGRTAMDVRGGGLQNTREYRLIYQDLAGGWHETWFVARQQDLVVKLLGPLRRWHHVFKRSRLIPKAVQERGNVVRSPEAV